MNMRRKLLDYGRVEQHVADINHVVGERTAFGTKSVVRPDVWDLDERYTRSSSRHVQWEMVSAALHRERQNVRGGQRKMHIPSCEQKAGTDDFELAPLHSSKGHGTT